MTSPFLIILLQDSEMASSAKKMRTRRYSSIAEQSHSFACESVCTCVCVSVVGVFTSKESVCVRVCMCDIVYVCVCEHVYVRVCVCVKYTLLQFAQSICSSGYLTQ